MTCFTEVHSLIKERILAALAVEQEQLAKILTALAIKVEKSAKWLPDEAPNECFEQITEKVKCLESVIAEELEATAEKERAIKGILKQIGDGDVCPPSPRQICPCPCELFQICKIKGRCVRKDC